MTNTVQQPTDTVEETRDQQSPDQRSPRPARRRRILLMAVVGITLLGLVALVLAGGIFNQAATAESEPTMTAIQIIPLDHPRGDVRRRHQVAAEHRRDGAGGVLRRRLFHAGHDRQGDPGGLPGQHRHHHHRCHLLLQHGAAQRHHRHHRPDLRPPGPGQDAPAPLGVLPDGRSPDLAGHLLPRRRRAAGTGRHRPGLRIPHPPGTDGRVPHQRCPRRRFLPALRGRRAGARHRREERLPHLAGRTVHGQLRHQPDPLRPDRGAVRPAGQAARQATASTPTSTRPAPAARTASRS